MKVAVWAAWLACFLGNSSAFRADRRFQRQYCGSLRPGLRSFERQATISSALQDPLSFRSATVSDLTTISELCADAFSGPFSWWQVLQRTAATTRFRAVLSRRLIATQVSPKAGEERLLHALVVATIGAQVVGFVEVGLLPSPLNAPEEVSAEEEAPAADEAASADPGTASLWQEALQSQEDRIRGTPLRKDNVPFLANLVVSRDFRRRGVGRGLVRVCGELVRRRWELPQIFVAVERDNAAAQKLYEEAGFAVVGSGGPIEEDTSAGPRRKRYFSDRVVYMRKELAPLVRNPVVEATETSEEAKEAEETET